MVALALYATLVCAFNRGGAWWRVDAALPDGKYDELNEEWVED